MALSIKSDEADQLARRLAARTGESLTEAVLVALRERLAREELRRRPGIRERVLRLCAEADELPVLDDRTPEEILGYDEHGLPT
jgi:antitoxin VapB